MNPLRADHISPLDMFKVGVGPSSSHTVGPMVAARSFTNNVKKFLEESSNKLDDKTLRITVELFGSLSATGKGHYTDGAVCAGLYGLIPASANPDQVWQVMPELAMSKCLIINERTIAFDPALDLIFSGWFITTQETSETALPHPNTMRFRLYQNSSIVLEEVILSVGGGFIEAINSKTLKRAPAKDQDAHIKVPYPYNSCEDFIKQCEDNQLEPWQIVIANEEARGLSKESLFNALGIILETMEKCIERGLNKEGILPGGLNVRRRAKQLYKQLMDGAKPAWSAYDLRPSVYAMAVNEENAAGGTVVTAPTNGSSGLIPSVWRTLKESNSLSRESLIHGLIVASVIGALVKVHASISGAEVGCQGEVGTSCAMAAAGATIMLGGSPRQMEQAAEIAIEHHLGMTCDPIMGLVQVPCIERNAMGAVKALNAVALSLASDGSHLVSLDRALEVMKQTGIDMNQKYKETSTGGLALG